MYSFNCSVQHAAKHILMLCVLTLLASGCGSLAARIELPLAPRTPGAVMTDEYICIPHSEAAELLLWIENAESVE